MAWQSEREWTAEIRPKMKGSEMKERKKSIVWTARAKRALERYVFDLYKPFRFLFLTCHAVPRGGRADGAVVHRGEGGGDGGFGVGVGGGVLLLQVASFADGLEDSGEGACADLGARAKRAFGGLDFF